MENVDEWRPPGLWCEYPYGLCVVCAGSSYRANPSGFDVLRGTEGGGGEDARKPDGLWKDDGPVWGTVTRALDARTDDVERRRLRSSCTASVLALWLIVIGRISLLGLRGGVGGRDAGGGGGGGVFVGDSATTTAGFFVLLRRNILTRLVHVECGRRRKV